MNYRCKVVDKNGKVLDLNIEAKSINNLNRAILAKNYSLLSFKKKRLLKVQKLSKLKILLFTQTLQLLINSNLTILHALEISLETFKDEILKQFTENIIHKLKGGDSFSNILNSSGVGFSPLYLGLIRVGEKTGNLSIVLSQLYNYLERGKKFRDKIIGALIYPLFILLITFVFSIVFVIIILPNFNQMFSTLGGGLEEVLQQRGEALTLLLVILGSLSLIIIFIIINSSKMMRIEKLLLSIPIIGKIIIENETFNLVFALSVLTRSSLSIEDSLEYAKDVLNNTYLVTEVENILKNVRSGRTLSISFSETLFPIKVSSFVQVGEKTGNITEIFEDLSSYYLKDSERKLDRFMSIIDPIFTLLLGAALFSLIILFILPVLTEMGNLL